MTALAEALRACASGILTADAGVSLLIGCGGWLRIIHQRTEPNGLRNPGKIKFREGSMSYDMAVWEGEPPADDATARATFHALYEQYAKREYPTPPTSKIAEFAAILVERWPDTEEAFDESPWAAAP